MTEGTWAAFHSPEAAPAHVTSAAQANGSKLSAEEAGDVDAAVLAVVTDLRKSGERELPARRVGEFVMAQLKLLDQVAYVRFASVYRSFQDVQDFREEIEKLQRDLPAAQTLDLPLEDTVPKPAKSKKA